MLLLRLVVIYEGIDDLVDCAEDKGEDHPYVADAASPDERAGDSTDDGFLLVVVGGEELAATVLAQEVLFAIVFPTVPLYSSTMTMWTSDCCCFRS